MRVIVGLLSLILIAPVLSAASDEEERIANGAEVLQEILNIPDGLPKDLLNKAECVVVLPSVKKFAFGVAGREATSPVHGARPQCIVWREPASDSSWEARLPTFFSS
jgi:lipid-binding SYLF domain-containing protein